MDSTRAWHGQSFSTSLIDVSTIDVDQSSFTLVEFNLIKIFPSHDSNADLRFCRCGEGEVVCDDMLCKCLWRFDREPWIHPCNAKFSWVLCLATLISLLPGTVAGDSAKKSTLFGIDLQSFNKRKVWDVNSPGNIAENKQL